MINILVTDTIYVIYILTFMIQLLVMEDVLQQIGLSDKETKLYLLLLNNPKLTAQELAMQSDIKRTNVYMLLENLTEQSLIIADDSPVRRFSVSEPHSLQKLVQRKQEKHRQVSAALSAAMPQFRSQYSLATDKPGVIHMAGTEGFEQLLEDAVRSKTEILLVASNDVPNDETTLARFRNLLVKRKEAGVGTRALFHDGIHRQKIEKDFTERGIDVRFLGTIPFKGEVAIYEDNTTFTVYDPSLVVTVITNTHITATMRTLFEQLWTKAQ